VIVFGWFVYIRVPWALFLDDFRSFCPDLRFLK
jgi:hypothetical protein